MVGSSVDNGGGRDCRDSGEIGHLTRVRSIQTATATEQWQASEPADVLACLGAGTWWIAGGRALDLYLGRTSRPHADLDIGAPRRDIGEILRCLVGWDICEAKDGILTSLESGVLPRRDVNSLWCRPQGTIHWKFEMLLDEVLGDTWVYRRDPRITRLMDDAVKRTGQDLPFLAPEIQLLYKSKLTRDRDSLDFLNVSPHLSASARLWLKNALELTTPSHEWTALLDNDA
jgi:hypothetical protein